METLVGRLDYICVIQREICSSTLFRLANICESGFSKTETLLHLLEHFPDNKCSDPRDRIYSLLSTAGGSFSDLEVNYQTSRIELAAQVLTRCRNSLCLCTALLVAQVLELGDEEFLGQESHRQSQLCLEFCVVDYLTKRHLKSPPQKLVLRNRRQLPNFSFYETCTSRSLNGLRIPWDLLAAPIEHLTFWGKEWLAHWRYIGIARIPHSFLATIVKFFAKLCRLAGKGESVRGCLPIGYSRICYAADPMKQPGTEEP